MFIKPDELEIVKKQVDKSNDEWQRRLADSPALSARSQRIAENIDDIIVLIAEQLAELNTMLEAETVDRNQYRAALFFRRVDILLKSVNSLLDELRDNTAEMYFLLEHLREAEL